MNFIRINWELNNGNTGTTEVNEEKADAVLQKLNTVTKAWISER